jgi:hypothetical protein
MSKLLCVIWISLATVSALCQSTGKYQVGTITDVKLHQVTADAAPDVVSYDVSLKVKDTIYLLLYTPPLGMNTVRYAAGRDILVLVGKKTITYNDLLGQSYEVPIMNRRQAAE